MELMMSDKMESDFSYSNLNNWRKLYLSLMWFGSACLFLGCIAKLVQNPDQVPPIIIAFALIIFALTYWTHIAVTKRKVAQLKWLAFLNLIPFANLIGVLILLSIIRVSKNEVESSSI
jgi:hypothetical protein